MPRLYKILVPSVKIPSIRYHSLPYLYPKITLNC